jgi:phosphate/sulfate permease
MENIYIVIVGVLFILAISDLVVGVSNDAVNFLNSAIGAKAAPLRVILIVAAAGVIAGATFSNGMMEVARKGIFNPSSFYFSEIMIIFLAVMLSDVILLDLFNTFGLPTSTTVSIVFELLGAAVALAIIKVMQTTGDFAEMVNYINTAKALAIISGILVSVIIAFTIGAIVMWFSRIIFSFNYAENIKYFGGIFGGLAVTAITYFILIKGLKGSVYAENIFGELPLTDWAKFLGRQNYDGFKSLVGTLGSFDASTELANWGQKLSTFDKDSFKEGILQFQTWVGSSGYEASIPLTMVHFVKYYLFKILLISFIGFSLITQLLYRVFRVNIFKVVVLIGTFALAMAFAGNDLVNFIGVPLAGLASYKEFAATGVNPDSLFMSALAGPVKTPTIFLLIAGLIMVITLWLSKKARSVVKTTLNLSDQETTNERFESTVLARAIVRHAINANRTIEKIVPKPALKWIGKRFDTSHYNVQIRAQHGISFDLIRASVNLVIASILIAIGTSLKLPLSTTYVTFMVAMGTSLADGAWGRESAVYRITGVITVIGGWFLTALSAFTMAFVIALILYKTSIWGVFGFSLLAVFIIYRTHIIHKKRLDKESKEERDALDLASDGEGIYEKCSNSVASLLMASAKNYEYTIKSFVHEKRKHLKEALKVSDKLNWETKRMKKNIPEVIRELNEESFESGHLYVEVLDYTRETMHSLYYISHPAYTHVDNNHKALSNGQNEALTELVTDIYGYIEQVVKSISENDYKKESVLVEESSIIIDKITRIRKKHLKQIKNDSTSTRSNIIFLDILNETRNYLLNANNAYKSFRDMAVQNQQLSINRIL